jgi:hypothetical protein
MKELKFSTNWNNKLECTAFTTLRRHYKSKYVIGESLLVSYPGVKFVAIVWDVKRLRVRDLNNYICFLDTGYNVCETKEILKKMYSSDYSDNMLMDFVLLVKEKTIQSRISRKKGSS